jgi:hypothetical protein
MRKALVFNGQKVDEEDFSLEKSVRDLRSKLDYLYRLSIEDLIDFFAALIKQWEDSGLNKKYLYLKNLSEFFKKDNLQTTLKVALHGDYRALDEFVDLGDRKFLFKAQPRGLTVHWLAGNVTILGLFSIFTCILTKNACLVKASSAGWEELIDFLTTLNQVKTNDIDGRELAQCINVVLLEREDIAAHRQLSLAADARIAWGGRESIETIIGLNKKLFCEDLIFGPKYSYAVIDKESLAKSSTKLAQRLAIDVSVFDQYACSSPHTVFVEEAEKGQAIKFAKELAKQLEFVNRAMIPKGETDPAKAMEIITLRTEYELKGQVFSSQGTEWTVVYTEEEGLAKGYFSRVIVVKPIIGLEKIKEYNDRQKQTLGVGLSGENKLKFLPRITQRGIDRCPDLGFMTFYESPWDGMFVFDRLVRWVTVYK